MTTLPLLLTLLTSSPDASVFDPGRYAASEAVLSTPLTGFGLDVTIRGYRSVWLNVAGDWSPWLGGHAEAGARLMLVGSGPAGLWAGWHYALKGGGATTAHGPGLSLGLTLVSKSGFAATVGADLRYLTGTFRTETTIRTELPALLGGLPYEISRTSEALASRIVPGIRLSIGFAGEP